MTPGEIFQPIDRHFAALMQQLSGGDCLELALAATLVSRRLAEGHSCLSLNEFAGKVFPEVSPAVFPTRTAWETTLRASAVVGAFEEAWSRLRESNHDALTGGFMPRNVMLVTGPSRSADIEQTLELGAHGPRRLHVVLVDDEGGQG